MRPSHWLKNSFVLAPAVFGLRFADPAIWPSLFLAVAAFCLAASATYLVNDVVDQEADRHNPRTRSRPVASGELAPRRALTIAAILVLAAFALAWRAGCVSSLAAYAATSFGYSLLFKRVVFLDVVSLASLYVVRLLAGAQAAQVPPSPWLLLCGGTLALLLAFGKRLERPDTHYSPRFLRLGVDALTVATFLAYGAYSWQETTRHTFSSWFLLTDLPVALGLWRYRCLARAGQADPSQAFFRDRGLQAATLLWGVMVVLLALDVLGW